MRRNPTPRGEARGAAGGGGGGRAAAPRSARRTGPARVAAAQTEEAATLRVLAAHVDGIVFELDRDARFTSVWASDPAMLARPERELLGRTVVETLGEAVGAPLEAFIRRTLETGQPAQFEYTLDVRSGRRAFRANAVRLPPKPGQAPTVTVLVRDVTEHVQMQARLSQSERLASVGLLAAGVAHEINNPLAYMLLNLDHLRTALARLAQELPERSLGGLAEAAQISWEGARRVEQIVRDLLVFARTQRAERVPIDLRQSLAAALDIALNQHAKRAGARITQRVGPVPLVRASEVQLVQVFTNLITNALEAAAATGEGAACEMRLTTRTDERGWAVAEVGDSGPGMAPEVLARAFDPFFTTKESRVGLGLSICHGLVTGLGGEITAESTAGRGAVFRVSLPPAEEQPGGVA